MTYNNFQLIIKQVLERECSREWYYHFSFLYCLLIAKYLIHEHCAGFELPLVACCGYGGKYNYSSSVDCGRTTEVNGTKIFVGSCERPSVRVNWDGIHYTEAASKFIFEQISTGAFSDPPLPLNMACHRNYTKNYWALVAYPRNNLC